jgi:hemerythrin
MAFYSWKQEYSVGNDLIDKQHQVLIEMINKMHDAMKMGKGSSESEKIVSEMIEYSAMHFAAEENLMKQIHFTGLTEHLKEHKAFMVKALEFQNQINLGSFTLSMDIANFLKDWLTNHILINDKAYAKELKKN